ncbi:HD domain-containing protein [uncultured Tyzzerella sp.]|uniref:HD domain-containing protein n=1 Tax=uncultured Tyzzerella sp. TaxID=2321398 RepID=UPI002942A866|nr:HD domain-containing protein [uncultured Tyzzerella sp.]
MENLKKQMNFLIEIDKLKNVFRQTLISDKSRNENDAEHSWHMAMYAVILEKYAPKGTDILKVIKMALIHDIIEIYAGDTFLYDEELTKSKEKREKEAAKKIYSILPDKQGKEIKALWEEFEEKQTKEAIFCATIDRIQPIILNYLTQGGTWKKHNVKKDMVLKKGYLIFEKADERLKQYVLEIIEESVKLGYLLP